MSEVAFAENDRAVFSCSKCSKSKITDVSKYILSDSEVKLKYKCACGNTNKVILERRRNNRQSTSFTGVYTIYDKNSEASKGLITICNISLTGLRFKVEGRPNLSLYSKIRIEFKLNGKQRISKKGIIKNSMGNYYGIEFCEKDKFDKTIKYFITSKKGITAFTHRILM